MMLIAYFSALLKKSAQNMILPNVQNILQFLLQLLQLLTANERHFNSLSLPLLTGMSFQHLGFGLGPSPSSPPQC